MYVYSKRHNYLKTNFPYCDRIEGLISVQKNIPYLKEDDGLDKHKLDIYLPLGAGESLHNLPLVIHFHGGGWVRGDRKDEFRGAPAVCR